jgi:hypothetical protein
LAVFVLRENKKCLYVRIVIEADVTGGNLVQPTSSVDFVVVIAGGLREALAGYKDGGERSAAFHRNQYISTRITSADDDVLPAIQFPRRWTITHRSG